MNPYGVPETSVEDVAARMKAGDEIVILDVREPHELMRASLGDGVLLAPLSDLAARRLEALPPVVADNPDAEIIVMCHHGGRSAQVTAWLRANGWTNVVNMAGGIDAWARLIDSSVGRY